MSNHNERRQFRNHSMKVDTFFNQNEKYEYILDVRDDDPEYWNDMKDTERIYFDERSFENE